MSIEINFFVIFITISCCLNFIRAESDKFKIIEDGHSLRIPIHRQKTPLEQHINSPFYEKGGLKWIYDLGSLSKGNRTNDTITLYRYLNREFYGKIVVGSPGQSLNVAFDTTWTYSWLMSADCSALEDIGCYFHNKYNHRGSSSYKEDGRPFNIDDGNFTMKGYYSRDNISITHSNVTNFTFIEMTHVPKLMIFNKADGVLGLGPETKDYEPFFSTLYRQKKIKDPIFSIYFNRDTQSNRGGVIYLGFINPKHVKGGKDNLNNIKYLPAETDSSYWQFQMDRINMTFNPKKNFTYCAKGCKAVIDTSASTIIGPSAEVNKIHENIGARKLFFNRYSVDCEKVNTLPKMEFVVAGNSYILTGPRYITRMTFKSVSVCISSFQPAERPFEEERWFLGSSFLTEAYTIFKPLTKKIGLINAA